MKHLNVAPNVRRADTNSTLPTCYSLNGEKGLRPDPSLTPCGGSTTNNTFCCVSDNICEQDSICHFTNTPSYTTSGYYVGGCTDKTFNDPACSKACSDQAVTDVVYNEKTGLWQCCGTNGASGGSNCADPGTETFQAPAPESLSPAPSYTPSSSSSPTTSKSLSTPSTSSSISSATLASVQPSALPPDSTSQNGLSTGAKVGIGIGTAIAGVSLIVLLAFLLLRSRHSRQKLQPSVIPEKSLGKELDGQPVAELGGRYHAELGGRSHAELEGMSESELEARERDS